ncbi:hypothetical protein IL306_012490 [Fusarium sp. DS 682]|nr:hypothetical protein IL306_012490 [Fusarium sp. DS 682]
MYRRYIGPNGRLRASHRAVNYESLANLGQDEYQKLMGPALEVAGRVSILQGFDGVDKHLVNYNVGRHRLHTGGGYESQFLVNLWRSRKEDGIGERA